GRRAGGGHGQRLPRGKGGRRLHHRIQQPGRRGPCRGKICAGHGGGNAMNTPAIQMAALDLDGTLLDRTSRITPRTLDAIGQAVRRGVVVLPATGRGLSALPRVAAALPGVRYAITSNGAAVWDMGDDPAAAIRSCYGDPGPEPVKQPVCLHYSPLAPATARAVYDLLE